VILVVTVCLHSVEIDMTEGSDTMVMRKGYCQERNQLNTLIIQHMVFAHIPK
jgi:hypothetical protein